jgi:hypothetical protein
VIFHDFIKYRTRIFTDFHGSSSAQSFGLSRFGGIQGFFSNLNHENVSVRSVVIRVRTSPEALIDDFWSDVEKWTAPILD